MSYRAGSVVFLGRPNAGKSTLMNHLLGEKLAIVSDKPQTTRHRIVGILSDDEGQVLFLDTPGIHKPMHRLNQQMVRRALAALADADVLCLIVDASQPAGGGDAFVLDLVAKADLPRILVLNKIDRIRDKTRLLPRIQEYSESGLFEEIIPISALKGEGADRVLATIRPLLPEGEALVDPELLTLHPERFLVSERIREAVLLATRDEIPYSTAVRIDRWEEPEEGRPLRLYASILAERPGQKKILIGRAGEMIKGIGIAARREIEDLLQQPVYLSLEVKHEPGWRDDRALLSELDRDLDGIG